VLRHINSLGLAIGDCAPAVCAHFQRLNPPPPFQKSWIRPWITMSARRSGAQAWQGIGNHNPCGWRKVDSLLTYLLQGFARSLHKHTPWTSFPRVLGFSYIRVPFYLSVYKAIPWPPRIRGVNAIHKHSIRNWSFHYRGIAWNPTT
jgi:hypothetical protein